MNDFASRIEKNIRKNKNHNGKNSFENVSYSLIKNTNITLSDLCNAPTPFIIEMYNRLVEQNNKEAKKLSK